MNLSKCFAVSYSTNCFAVSYSKFQMHPRKKGRIWKNLVWTGQNWKWKRKVD